LGRERKSTYLGEINKKKEEGREGRRKKEKEGKG